MSGDLRSVTLRTSVVPGFPTAPAVREGVRLPGWVRLVVAVAATKVAVGTAALAVVDAWRRAIPPAIFMLLVAVCAGAALALMVLGRADRRAVSLGVFFLLVAASFASPLLLLLVAGVPPLSPALLFLQALQVEVYLPYFFWMFVRDFPRARRVGLRSRLFRATVRATLVACTLLLVANTALAFGLPDPLQSRVARWLGRDSPGSLYWRVIYLSIIPAGVYALRRARSAASDERRRVRILFAGLLLGVAPIIIISVTAALVPAFFRYRETTEGVRTLGLVVYPAILAMPVVIAYAVLAHRALDLRLIVRRAVRYGLAQYTVLLVATVPFVWLVARMYTQRDRSLAELWSGTTGMLFAATTGLGVAMLVLRPRVADFIDRRFFREQYDARQILADLVQETRSARDAAALAAVLARELDRALHLRSVSTFLLNPVSGLLEGPGGAPGLAATSDLARIVEAEAAPVELDWLDPSGWLSRLPEADQRWLADVDAQLLVPFLATDGSMLGVLALGEKRSELPFLTEDRLLLSTVAASVGLTLEHRMPSAGVQPQQAARECPGCGIVAGPDGERCATCGRDTKAAALPLVVAGKFRVRERIGSGGMGVVYRAEDLALGREVAIKTLPRMSPREAARLRREARAMAAVGHPNLAQIFGAESWDGVPMLVVEYLPGRTLADRLTQGPVLPVEALDLVGALTRALSRLHASAILHRDVKPSNIGFAADGMPKLLDFGLARVLEAAHAPDPDVHRWRSLDEPAAGPLELAAAGVSQAADWSGTPLYLSPEVLNGEVPDPSSDLWALCMVLYEALAGRHPLAGETPHWALVRAAEADLPDIREIVPGLPATLAGFIQDALHADRGRRPRSAHELEHRLRALREHLQGVRD